MQLKGYKVGGYLVIAENETEATKLLTAEGCKSYSNVPVEADLDELFYYFNIDEILEEDHPHIYDRKYPSTGVQSVSLKSPYARKYKSVIGDKKEVYLISY